MGVEAHVENKQNRQSKQSNNFAMLTEKPELLAIIKKRKIL